MTISGEKEGNIFISEFGYIMSINRSTKHRTKLVCIYMFLVFSAGHALTDATPAAGNSAHWMARQQHYDGPCSSIGTWHDRVNNTASVVASDCTPHASESRDNKFATTNVRQVPVLLKGGMTTNSEWTFQVNVIFGLHRLTSCFSSK